jgi:hypothetical protein
MIKKIRLLAIFNFLAFLLAFTVSNLSQWGLLGFSNTMATVSAKYETVFTPAGITFAIWGIIYIALFAFCIYHIFLAYTQHADQRVNQDVRKMDLFFVLNNLATALWVYAFLTELLFASVVLIFIQLFSLLMIHIRLDIYNTRRALLGRVFSQAPLSIYFAWICVATVANTSAWLVAIDWDAWGIHPQYWAIVMIGVVTLISLFVIFVRRNIFFGIVVMWALYGIILKRQRIDADAYAQVILAAWSAFAMLGLSALVQLVKNWQSRPKLH